MESRKAARSEAVASPPDSKQSDEFQATCAEGLTRTNQLYQKKVLASTVSTVQCVHSVQIISFSGRQKK